MSFSEWSNQKKNMKQEDTNVLISANNISNNTDSTGSKLSFSDWSNQKKYQNLSSADLYGTLKDVVREDSDVQKELDETNAALSNLNNTEPTTLYAALQHNAEVGNDMPMWGPDTSYSNPTQEEVQGHGSQVLTQKEELEKKVKLLNDELYWNEYVRYMSNQNNAGFSKYSQYQQTGTKTVTDSGETVLSGEDEVYEYVNNRNGYRDSKVDPQTGRPYKIYNKGYQFLKEDEIKVYNYLYHSQGKEAANQFLDFMSTTLNARHRAYLENRSAEIADAHPFLSSVYTVVSAPAKAVEWGMQVYDYLDDGKIDQNAFYNSTSYISSAIRSKVADKIEKSGVWGVVGSFAYQTGMSMGDFLMTTAVSGGNQAMALAIMGSSAAADTTIQAKDRGLSDNQAFALGAIAGAAEILTEKIGLDALFDVALLNKNKFTYFLKNALGEAIEEPTSGLINMMADIYISKDKSEWEQSIKAYEEQGCSESDAFWKATLDQAKSLGLDALGGFFSGAALGGGRIAINAVGNAIDNRFHKAPSGDVTTNSVQSENGQASQETAAEPQPGTLEYVQMLNDMGQATGNENQNAEVSQQTAFDMYEDVLAQGTNASADPVSAAVDAFMTNGTITNKQAQDILNNSKALQLLRERVGLELPSSASGRRNAVKAAVAQLAAQTSVDTSAQTVYNNSTTQGGNNYAEGLQQNDRAGGIGDPAQGMAGLQQGNGSEIEGRKEHGGLAVNPGILRVSPELTAAQQRRGTNTYTVQDTTSAPERYEQALIDGRNSDQAHGWCVTPKTAQELRDGNVRTFMNDTGTVGFGIAPDGDIIAVFKNKNGGPSRALDTAMPIAIEQGGDRLDCYGDGLVNAYERYGFIPVARVEFNSDVSNDGWTPDKGTPYVYVMMHNGDSAAQVAEKMGNYPISSQAQLDALPTYGKDQYDDAMAYRDSLINGKKTSSQTVGAEASVGAAPAGFDPNSHLQYQYGTLPSGENAVRPDDLPVSTDGTNRVSQTAVTVKGAQVTPDSFVDLLNKDVTTENGMTYIPITNDATVQNAIDQITQKGWEASKGAWQADVDNGKAGADMSAMGALLLNHAAQAGDKTAWLDILHDYQRLGTNTAQGLQALRILKKLSPPDKLDMAKRTVQKMVKDMKLDTDIVIDPELEAEYNNAETDEQRDAVIKKIQKDVARQLPTTFLEKWTALRYVNMLGNLKTQGRNIIGNLSMKAVRSVHNAVAAGIETIANKASGGKIERTRSFTVSSEQKAAAAKDFEGLQDSVMDGGKFSDNMTATGFARGVQEQKQIFKLKPLEGYRKVTNWMMEKGDVIFAKDAYARALAGYLKSNGITQTDYSQIDPKIMDEARLFAVKEAQEATFRDTNALSGWISKFGRRADTPGFAKVISEGIMPFRKTPANVLVRAAEYSPLGVINSIATSVKAAQNGSDITATQVINSWSKSLTGTGIFLLGMLLNNLGLLSAGPDEDEKKEAFDDLNGWQNYAITLPDGTNFTIDCFSPSAIPLLMGAQFMKEIHRDGFQAKDLESALTSIADPLVKMSMLQGVNSALENIQYADNNLVQFAINAAVSYLTQGLTNTLFGQIERTFEDSRMQTYVDKDSDMPAWLQRTVGKASAKTPGLDYNQIPYINAWGEEEKNLSPGLNLVYNLLSPVYFDKGKDDKLTRELNRLHGAQSDINVYPSTPDKTVIINGEDYNLSSEEYVALAKLQGQTQKKLVEKIISSSDYAKLSDEEKAKAIQYAYEYARNSARGEVLDDHPGITTAWMKNITGDVADAIIRKVYTGTTEKYNYLTISDAKYVTDILDGIYPEAGKTNVRDIQKIEAIVSADDVLNYEEQKNVLKDNVNESVYNKYLSVLMLGMDNDDYAASYRTYLDEKDKGGKGTKARIIASYQKNFHVTYAVAEKLYDIYAGKK